MSEQFKSIETTELVKIANAIRVKTGTTDKISLEDMPAKIAAIESGAALPELENEGAASDLLSGKQLIDSEGNIVEGTIATKTASNLTVSGATVTVPAGYYASQATKSVATATQATPSITVNSSGLITASATQTAGYIAAGTKSGTKQLTVQAAKTVTPTKSSQTAVAKDRYTTGAVTVAAIPAQYITTTDATATAADMRSSKTAYVNGAKVTGSIADFDGSYECSGESTGGGSNNAQWIYCNDLPTTYIAVDSGGTSNDITVYLELTDDMDAVIFNIQEPGRTSPYSPLSGRVLIGRDATARWQICLTDLDLTTEIVSEDTCYFCKLTFDPEKNIYAHIIYV